MNPVDDLAAALDSTSALVAGVSRWDAPTPCPEWTVRDLVNHLVLGHRLFTAVLRGEEGGSLNPRSSDALGDDPVAAYREAVAGLLAAFRQPGVLEQVVEVPAGTVPGIAAVHLRIVEELVHGWDLARATGQEAKFDDALIEREIAFSAAKLADLPADRRPFAPPVSVAADAPPLDRLVALLGRAPS
ncbi:TIGR03086 family protein [Amycolatopsis sp. AA4]|uniref:TIGR03086 family metal-binding protein n=1 Tax=Actinomycetes TaxID=1760 RepID=UPI0002D5D92A|nr:MULTISPECIES: TIGR03086 family metal-binding protein [Actinomycetes]ATY16802.1 TIGR03086 family protein [Amycolatopsis sp. AA4]